MDFSDPHEASRAVSKMNNVSIFGSGTAPVTAKIEERVMRNEYAYVIFTSVSHKAIRNRY